MSWLFSRALVEASLGVSFSDGIPSAQSNGTPMPRAFCAPDKMTDFSRPSRFGMTFGHLTDGHGADVLTWCLADSLARTSAPQEKAPESKATAVGYGPSLQGSFAKYSHDSHSWKTAQCSLLGGLESFLETWPRWGLMRDGACWQRPTLARPTSEIVSGLWPTPVADDTGSRTKKYAQGGTPLSLAIKLWPTPTAVTNTGGAALCKWGGSGSREKLRSMVTPQELNGALNPTWVEWLMGWPLGWTDLQPSATDKYRNVQPMLGAA